MKKTSTPPTVAEQLEQAKDSWFYEFDLKQWIHVSQVETEEKAQKLVREKTRFQFWRFVNGMFDTNMTGASAWVLNHQGFLVLWCSVLCLVVFFLPLVFGYGFSLYTFYAECVWARVVMWSLILLAYGPFAVWFAGGRKMDIRNTAEDIFSRAADLKNGIFYDVVGNKRFFRN